MAKVVVTNKQDWVKIAQMAGGDHKNMVYEPKTNELEVLGTTQAALDKALADYKADQVNIDAATKASKTDSVRESAKTKLVTLGFTDEEIERIV